MVSIESGGTIPPSSLSSPPLAVTAPDFLLTSIRSKMPIVMYTIRHDRKSTRLSDRTIYPMELPLVPGGGHPRSSATRWASEMAATFRGCVTTMYGRLLYEFIVFGFCCSLGLLVLSNRN